MYVRQTKSDLARLVSITAWHIAVDDAVRVRRVQPLTRIQSNDIANLGIHTYRRVCVHVCACASIACRRPEAVERRATPAAGIVPARVSGRAGKNRPYFYGCMYGSKSSTDGPIEIHFTKPYSMCSVVCRQYIREQRTAEKGQAVELARYAAEKNPARQDMDGHKTSPPSQSTRRLPACQLANERLRKTMQPTCRVRILIYLLPW